MGKVTIHVCPNGCTTTFTTVAHVAQDWKVDALGNYLECVGNGETVAPPDNGNIWECNKCGAEAKMVDCFTVDIGTAMVFVPQGHQKDELFVYYTVHGSGEISRTPIQAVEDQRLVVVDGQIHSLRGLEALAET